MTGPLQVAPILSTPDTHIFEAPVATVAPQSTTADFDLDTQYEISRTIADIKRNKWKRIALQFPDNLLPDAPSVYRRLRNGLKSNSPKSTDALVEQSSALQLDQIDSSRPENSASKILEDPSEVLSILADTSYGACCVDEVAAQHVSADVVIHYGRACLSPTSHLPTIHVFTVNPLPLVPVVQAFESTFPSIKSKVILTSDVTYSAHLAELTTALNEKGYSNIYTTETKHDPASLIPNRSTPTSDSGELKEWDMFHIGEPPQALLLTLASRVSEVYIYPCSPTSPTPVGPVLASTSLALRRRYALLTRLSRAPIIGILINTLSVHAYMNALSTIQDFITQAGKKYYVFVVGKLNPAKIANFAEVGGWVVVGCWESSLVESGEFEKPVVVPWELELALKGDDERVWTGEWRGDFNDLVERGNTSSSGNAQSQRIDTQAKYEVVDLERTARRDEFDSEEESEPPEFDLRTGRYVQHSRPMRRKPHRTDTPRVEAPGEKDGKNTNSLVQRAKGDLARVGGEISPGAEFLQTKRTWRGLGSDFEIAYDQNDGPAIEEGRSGIARGYRNEEKT